MYHKEITDLVQGYLSDLSKTHFDYQLSEEETKMSDDDQKLAMQQLAFGILKQSKDDYKNIFIIPTDRNIEVVYKSRGGNKIGKEIEQTIEGLLTMISSTFEDQKVFKFLVDESAKADLVLKNFQTKIKVFQKKYPMNYFAVAEEDNFIHLQVFGDIS